MKLFKITYYDAWEGQTFETYIFAQSALDAKIIFAQEEAYKITDVEYDQYLKEHIWVP